MSRPAIPAISVTITTNPSVPSLPVTATATSEGVAVTLSLHTVTVVATGIAVGDYVVVVLAVFCCFCYIDSG